MGTAASTDALGQITCTGWAEISAQFSVQKVQTVAAVGGSEAFDALAKLGGGS